MIPEVGNLLKLTYEAVLVHPCHWQAARYGATLLVKHITPSGLSPKALRSLGGTVMQLAKVKELEAHCRAIIIHL
jgi:hypothetical protein